VMETNSTPLLEKSCVVWSARRQREISLHVYFDVEEQDGCKIYTLQRQIERD
jgi:hypothetical protein